jgi:hypothetical protein
VEDKTDGRDPGEERVGVANSRDMIELWTVSQRSLPQGVNTYIAPAGGISIGNDRRKRQQSHRGNIKHEER